MTKFKKWLLKIFLPAYQQESYIEENRRLTAKLKKARHEIEICNARIAGLEYALRRGIVVKIEKGD